MLVCLHRSMWGSRGVMRCTSSTASRTSRARTAKPAKRRPAGFGCGFGAQQKGRARCPAFRIAV